mmetsp:Transcript_1131/g.2130  ORF Transcript_1131/g.2130 Transcript_1131/m.2130 type:complete len:255 (-) Transcript_1131:1160-1924(-)
MSPLSRAVRRVVLRAVPIKAARQLRTQQALAALEQKKNKQKNLKNSKRKKSKQTKPRKPKRKKSKQNSLKKPRLCRVSSPPVLSATRKLKSVGAEAEAGVRARAEAEAGIKTRAATNAAITAEEPGAGATAPLEDHEGRESGAGAGAGAQRSTKRRGWPTKGRGGRVFSSAPVGPPAAADPKARPEALKAPNANVPRVPKAVAAARAAARVAARAAARAAAVPNSHRRRRRRRTTWRRVRSQKARTQTISFSAK